MIYHYHILEAVPAGAIVLVLPLLYGLSVLILALGVAVWRCYSDECGKTYWQTFRELHYTCWEFVVVTVFRQAVTK